MDITLIKMENEHFSKIFTLFSKLHEIYFRSFCAKFAYELINVLINKIIHQNGQLLESWGGQKWIDGWAGLLDT